MAQTQMRLVSKIIGYATFLGVLTAGSTVASLKALEAGGDPQVAKLTNDVQSLSEDVAAIKAQIEQGHQAALPVSVQYLLVSLPPTDAELKDQRLRDMAAHKGQLPNQYVLREDN